MRTFKVPPRFYFQVIVVALVAIIGSVGMHGETPTFRWVQQAGGTGEDYGSGVAMDGAGNTFVFAKFGNNLASLGSLTVSNADYFLAKYDPEGTPLWARPIRFPAYQGNLPLNYRLGCDATGNVYIGGSFWAGPIIFGDVALTNLNKYSLFLAKYDGSGNLAWATNASGHHPATWIRGPAFAVDADGNSYLAGSSLNAPDLGLPDILIDQVLRIYVAKFNPAGGGVWVRSYQVNTNIYYADSNFTTPIAMAVGPDGGFYLCGHFVQPTFSIGGVTLTNRNTNGISYEVFTARFDSDGDLLWARSGGSSTHDEVNGFGVDSAGNAYVSCFASIDPDSNFHFGDLMLTNRGNFTVKYQPDGTVEWLKQPIDFGSDTGVVLRFAVDGGGNSYTLGWYWNTAKAGPIFLPNPGYLAPSFLVKYDPNGAVLWAKVFPHGGTGSAYDWVRGTEEFDLFATSGGDLAITGNFYGLNSPFDGFTLTSAGQKDVFVARVDADRPRLGLFREGNLVVISWPTNVASYLLETAESLGTDTWDVVTNQATVVGLQNFVTNAITVDLRFYRLRKP